MTSLITSINKIIHYRQWVLRVPKCSDHRICGVPILHTHFYGCCNTLIYVERRVKEGRGGCDG